MTKQCDIQVESVIANILHTRMGGDYRYGWGVPEDLQQAYPKDIPAPGSLFV